MGHDPFLKFPGGKFAGPCADDAKLACPASRYIPKLASSPRHCNSRDVDNLTFALAGRITRSPVVIEDKKQIIILGKI